MVRMGYMAWCALMNRARLALPREPGCRLCQDVALLTQAMVLTSKARQFLPLSACRPVNALAGIPLGLLHPSGNRLGGRLELARQLFGRASRSHQIDHLSPELRRLSGSVAGHQTPQKSTSRVSIKPGQLHRAGLSQACPLWVNRADLAAIFAGCPEGYHVDHIWPLKGKLSCGLHVPWNLQYLPDTDNMSKGCKAPGQNYLDWWT